MQLLQLFLDIVQLGWIKRPVYLHNGNLIKFISKVHLKLILSKIKINKSTQIKEGDLEFALNRDYSEDVSGKIENNSESGESIMLIIDNLKQATKSLDDDQKKTIIKYLQNITQLTQLYNQ